MNIYKLSRVCGPVHLLSFLAALAIGAYGCGDNIPARLAGSRQNGAGGNASPAGANGQAGLGELAGNGGQGGESLGGNGGIVGEADAGQMAGAGGSAGAAAGIAGTTSDGGLPDAGPEAGGAGGLATDSGLAGNEGLDSAAGVGGSAGGDDSGGAGGAAGDGGASGTGDVGGGTTNCDGTDCVLPDGAFGICVANDFCGPCPSDFVCQDVYGPSYLCIGGECLTGACRAQADCGGGQLCDTGTNTCRACSDDATCAAGYGTGYVCVAGACMQGNCKLTSDCTGGQICDEKTRSCTECGSDNACFSAYGSNHLCVGNVCIAGDCRTAMDCSNGQLCSGSFCTVCSEDSACAAQYGAGHLCLSGGCVAGECRTAADCQPGQLCDGTFTCTGCATDTQCVSGYGANNLCVGGTCVTGNCRSTTDCGGGRVCDSSAFSCVACTSDAACVSNYGPGQLCVNGNCIAGNCRAAADCPTGEVCDANLFACTACVTDATCVAAYGPDHLCISGSCVPGQCRTSPECSGGALCNALAHTCVACGADADCVTGYGKNHLCIAGACVSGTCHDTSDCGGGQICDAISFSCGACPNDAACVSAYGPKHLCEANVCIVGACRTSGDCANGKICDAPTHTCIACQNDSACQNDAGYGTSTFCLGGACTPGDCHDTGECPSGQLCGSSQANTCGACNVDAQCTTDPGYGVGHICLQGICERGDCHGTSTDCGGASVGLVCGALSANTCGACSSDSQCQGDPVYGSSTICNTTAALPTTGQCVSASCNASGACLANGGDFCCSGVCVPGDCCADMDCLASPGFGVGYACVNNHCTGCSAATGNKYFVDPVNGNDATATGSGFIGGAPNSNCSFKTVTRALQVAGGFAVSGTQLIVVGRTGQMVSLSADETLPLLIPANITVTTKTGPILLTLPPSVDPSFSNIAGFQLAGDRASITPDPSAPLTIDGSMNTSGIGVGIAPGAGNSANMSYVTIQNTGGHGISVTNGTLSMGQGVTVLAAGSAAKRRDGLNISAGTVHISVASGQAATSFLDNTQHGIYVTGTGVLDVLGVPVTSPAPNGQGTVVVSGNFLAGVRIFEAPGGPRSTLDGLVVWANPSSGLRIYGGSSVRVRNSVLLANGTNGVYVTAYDGSGAGNDLSRIDLGTGGDPGRNTLQASLGSNPDVTGVCVSMAAGMGALTLEAAGNTFAGPIDCSLSTDAIVRGGTCSGFVDVGVVGVGGTNVTVDASGCH